MIKKIVVVIVSFFFSVNYVLAVSCDNDDIARLKGLAQNVNYYDEYIGDRDGVNDYQLYNVRFTGLNGEIYVSDNKFSFFVNSENDVVKLRSGPNSLAVYSKNCGDKLLRSMTVNLLKFNTYSLSDECSSIDANEFELCDPWYQGKIDNNYFSEKLNSYLESKETKKKNANGNRNVLHVVKKNLYVLVILGIVGLLLLVFFIKKRMKENKLD